MMTIMLPIPAPKKKVQFFYIPYTVEEGYMNNNGSIMLGQNDNFKAFREGVEDLYGVEKGSYLVSLVYNNQFASLWSCGSKVEDMVADQGVLLLYEIDPALKPTLPQQMSKTDKLYNAGNEHTMCMLNIQQWSKNRITGRPEKAGFLPRMLWVKKSWTMQELHLYVFKMMRMCLQEWADWTDPNTERKPKDASKKDLRKSLIEFPYRLDEDTPMTKEAFKALSDEEAFRLCYNGLVNRKEDGNDDSFDINQKPYQLVYTKIGGDYANCCYCNKTMCKGCPVPFDADRKVSDCLSEANHETN